MPRLAASTLASCADGIPVPAYDRGRVTAGVVHLGVGGFHRSHQAVYHDDLLASGGSLDWGICGVGVLESDRALHDALVAQDCLYTLVVKHADGTIEPRVIGSLVEHLLAPDDPDAVIERLAAATTRVVSMTITEGGYNVDDVTGRFDADAPSVVRDLAEPTAPVSAFGLVVEALRRRRERGLAPFTVLSCDNLTNNGHIARTAFGTFARLADPELGAWVEREVRFPSSVVDRITPATTDLDRAALHDLLGVEDRVPVVCEPFRQWVIEDVGPGALPPHADVRVVPDVVPHELMKLRLLNAGHQALAHLGRLCGLRFVHEAALDPDLARFLEAFLDEEAMPTLSGVPDDELASFRGSLVDRFANRSIADTLERLATDASDRIPKFLLPLVRERLAAGADVSRSAAIVAGWARCAAGADEVGSAIATRDRRAPSLRARAQRRLEDPGAFIADREIFGDLAEDEAFAAPYRRALAELDSVGARATVAALGSQQVRS